MTVSTDKDLAMEKHLTKKLKAKDGKRGGLNDRMDDLMDGICSYIGFAEAEPEVQRKQKRKKSGNSSVMKIKSSKPLEGSDSRVKNKGLVLLVDNESSEISVGEDTIFIQNGKDDNVQGHANIPCLFQKTITRISLLSCITENQKMFC